MSVGFEKMKHTLALLIIIFTLGCNRHGDQRLSGTFVSDKQATLAYLESTGHYDTNRLAKLGALFGKLHVTYEGTTCISTLNDYCSTSTFEIVETGSNHVLIKSLFAPDWVIEQHLLDENILVTNRIDFTPDGYWTTGSSMESPFREKFVRIEIQQDSARYRR